MATFNPPLPSLAPNYANIQSALEQRAQIESKRPTGYSMANAVLDPIAKQTEKFEEMTFQKDLADYKARLENELKRKEQDREFVNKGGIEVTAQNIADLETAFQVPSGTIPSRLVGMRFPNAEAATNYFAKPLHDKKLQDQLEKTAEEFDTIDSKKAELIRTLKEAVNQKDPNDIIKALREIIDPENKSKKQFVGQAGNKGVIFNPDSGTFETEELPGEVAPRNKRILPADTVEKLSDFKTIKGQLNILQEKVNKNFIGPAASRISEKAQLLDAVATEDQAIFSSTINSIRNQMIYLRSGKQINEKEYERLIKELPDEHKSVTDFKAKLKTFNRVFADTMSNRLNSFEKAGYIVPEDLKEITVIPKETKIVDISTKDAYDKLPSGSLYLWEGKGPHTKP